MRDWIKHNQILAFYLLVFGISWPAMLMLFYVFPENSGMGAMCGLAATFSPVLVALMISAITGNEPKGKRTPVRWLAFIGGWLFSWLIMALHMWKIRGMSLDLQVILPTALVAILPGWLISCAFSPLPGVKRLFGTILRPRGNWLWYLAAIVIVPAVQLIGAGVTILFGGDVEFSFGDLSLAGGMVFIVLTFCNGFLTSGGINEETGWRGFVLPRLQARYPVIAAIAIVWFFWALWHIPYDIGTHTPIQSIFFNRILLNFIWAVLFAWVYNRTGGSLLAPAIFHPAMNTFGDILPRTDIATVLFVILALAVIILDRMWKRLPAEHPAVFVER